jgi:Aromatic-ring-opening dioxygenase LigAB, LigA subunit
MSRYAVNKVLWEVARNDEIAAEYMATPEAVLADRGLTEKEYRQLLERDFGAMFADGAHPFLLFTFRIKISGGWSYPMMVEHVRVLSEIDPPLDIST